MAGINADRHRSISCYSILEGTCTSRNVLPVCDCSSYGTGREAAGPNLERENECVIIVSKSCFGIDFSIDIVW